jgi:periplasmic protein CpxP/Spy
MFYRDDTTPASMASSSSSPERRIRHARKKCPELFPVRVVGSVMKAPNKLALLCGVALASLTCNLVAQTTPPSAPAGNSGECPRGGKAGKHGGYKLIKELNLTDEQQAKVAPILEKAKADAKAIRADESLSKKQKHQQIEAVRQNTNQQLQAVLTPEQFQKFQEIRAEHKGKHGKGEKPSAPVTS